MFILIRNSNINIDTGHKITAYMQTEGFAVQKRPLKCNRSRPNFDRTAGQLKDNRR